MVQVCLSQFEWTLAARVNCADDDPTKGVQISSKTPPPCTDCSCKDLATGASNGKLESGGTSATVNGYFCVTAPVKAFEIEGKKLDPKNPHYVSDYTHTIIVDLRYSFRQRINVPECTPQVYSICYLDNIANKVQELVTCHLEIAKDTKFRYEC